MKSIEQFRREIAQLKAKQQVHEAMAQRNMERRQLIAEAKRLRHPKLNRFVSRVETGTRRVGSGVKKGYKYLTKPSKSKPSRRSYQQTPMFSSSPITGNSGMFDMKQVYKGIGF